MATNKTLFTGRRELTMEEYEALSSIDINKDYNITDYPSNGITNTQMAFALTCQRLFNKGETFTCIDGGTYEEGHIYRIDIVEGAKAWTDITAGGGSGGAQHITLTTLDTPISQSDLEILKASDENYIVYEDAIYKLCGKIATMYIYAHTSLSAIVTLKVNTLNGGTTIESHFIPDNPMNNPMTNMGSLIVGGFGGYPEQLTAGRIGQVLTMDYGRGPVWKDVVAGTAKLPIIGGLSYYIDEDVGNIVYSLMDEVDLIDKSIYNMWLYIEDDFESVKDLNVTINTEGQMVPLFYSSTSEPVKVGDLKAIMVGLEDDPTLKAMTFMVQYDTDYEGFTVLEASIGKLSGGSQKYMHSVVFNTTGFGGEKYEMTLSFVNSVSTPYQDVTEVSEAIDTSTGSFVVAIYGTITYNNDIFIPITVSGSSSYHKINITAKNLTSKNNSGFDVAASTAIQYDKVTAL